MKIKLNGIQITATVGASIILLYDFLLREFYCKKAGYSAIITTLVALIIFLYLARTKNSN